MNFLIEKYGLQNKFTKAPPPTKSFNKFENTTPQIEDFNIMADVLYLPKTKEGFNYLLVIVDLATKEVDFEPVKNTNSQTILDATKKIFKRKHIKEPYASISTDAGIEFKSVFHKFFKDKNIYHKIALPNRHTQQAPVENANRQIGYILNMYMNKREVETGKIYREWTDILDQLREDMNKIRKKKLPDKLEDIKIPDYTEALIENEPKYKVGDVVHIALDYPKNALNQKQNTSVFRVGDIRWDTQSRKILKIVYMADKPYYRYIVSGIKNASFTENQLKLSDNTEETYFVKKIIGEKTQNKIKYYLVWWKGKAKTESSYEPEKNLIEDGLKDYIDEYKKNKKKKR